MSAVDTIRALVVILVTGIAGCLLLMLLVVALYGVRRVSRKTRTSD